LFVEEVKLFYKIDTGKSNMRLWEEHIPIFKTNTSD